MRGVRDLCPREEVRARPHHLAPALSSPPQSAADSLAVRDLLHLPAKLHSAVSEAAQVSPSSHRFP